MKKYEELKLIDERRRLFRDPDREQQQQIEEVRGLFLRKRKKMFQLLVGLSAVLLIMMVLVILLNFKIANQADDAGFDKIFMAIGIWVFFEVACWTVHLVYLIKWDIVGRKRDIVVAEGSYLATFIRKGRSGSAIVGYLVQLEDGTKMIIPDGSIPHQKNEREVDVSFSSMKYHMEHDSFVKREKVVILADRRRYKPWYVVENR